MLKKIFTNVYTVLFVYVTLIAHIIDILCLSFPITSEVGLLCLFLFSLSLVGFGYFWAKKLNCINFTAYFAIFALAIYALFCLNLAFILSEWSYSDKYFVQIALYSNPIFLLANLAFIFVGKPLYAFLFQVIVYAAFGGGFALALYKKGLLKPTKSLKILISVILVLAIAAVAQWSFKNSLFLPSSIAKLQSLDDSPYKSYVPLRGEPSVKFENDFPILDGATALCPLISSVEKAMQGDDNDYPYYCSTTPYAYKSLFNGETELILVAAPSNEQLEEAKAKGLELTLTPIAKEAFVFIVNKENPISSLSVQNIKDIYSGKIKNWREVGGEDEKILAFQRNKNSGSQSAMQNYVMKDTPFIEPMKEEFYSGMGGMMDGVANYRNAKNAIGYSFRYYATVMNSNINIKLLNIEGIEPTVQNIKNNTYPFTAEFYIINTQNISADGKKLVEWFLSEQGQALVEDVGYVPIREF
jgi:phosphate transport system substrate-binding protein